MELNPKDVPANSDDFDASIDDWGNWRRRDFLGHSHSRHVFTRMAR